KRIVALLYIADDIEHMGDVIEIGIIANISKLMEKDINFSTEGQQELENFLNQIIKMFRITIMAVRKEDKKAAREIIEMKSNLRHQEKDLRKAHLDRLLLGRPEAIESGTIHMDLLGEMRRVRTLCSKIAYTLLDEF
ncbi:PhoU domain-containing protein, partial [candidate division CSSED10-310 bacterium]